MLVTFLGAAREVTGASILVEALGKKVLLDCGFFQGSKEAEERNYAPFAIEPKRIDALIVCHAHLDHVGRTPKLVREGFRGRIYCTAPTKELAYLVMEDNAKLMREEAKKDNHPPLYLDEDIAFAMQLFEACHYDEQIEIVPGFVLTLKNAGHILGSAIAVLTIEEKTLVYTSDLGNTPSELLSPPAKINRADYVICESTYGGRIHEDSAKRHEKLTQIINSTTAQNGVLLIPAFAVERTQELLHDIEHFCTQFNCEIPTFYLDSPLAQKVTRVFDKYPEYLNKELTKIHKSRDIFGLARLKITSTVRESQKIDLAPSPKIIIAGSGMMNGGRILYHLQNYIGDSKNTLLIVGYQAKGTLGRRLLDGEKTIKIFGKRYEVAATILAISSYSAHADSPQIVDWISGIDGVRKVFLVHGETDQSLALSRALKSKTGVEVLIPQQGEEYTLNEVYPRTQLPAWLS